MDETKYVAVPVAMTEEMLEADTAASQALKGRHTLREQQRACWSAALAAAPTTHVAVERQMMKRIGVLLLQAPYKDDKTRDECGEIFSKITELLSKGETT